MGGECFQGRVKGHNDCTSGYGLFHFEADILKGYSSNVRNYDMHCSRNMMTQKRQEKPW